MMSVGEPLKSNNLYLPPPTVTQGGLLNGNLKIFFNGAVVLFSVVCFLMGGICILITPIDIYQYTFFTHGLKYFPLFYSLWGSVVQTVYFQVMFGMDILDIYSRNNTKLIKILNKLKVAVGYLFYVAAFPMSTAISALFWATYSIDRELIYPRILDEVYPYWVNHAMHTIPMVLMVIYLLVEDHHLPPLRHSLSGTLGILGFYACCVFYVKKRDNLWMYYGLHQFTDHQVAMLLFSGTMANIFATLLGHAIGDLKNNWRKIKME